MARKKMKHRNKRARQRKVIYLDALQRHYPQDIPAYAVGNCGIVAEHIARQMVKDGMTLYKVVDGKVRFGNSVTYTHTWMEYGNTIYDPCLEQFSSYGYDVTAVEYLPIEKVSPSFYVSVADAMPLPDEYIQHVKNDRLRSSRMVHVDGVVVYDLKEQPLKVAG